MQSYHEIKALFTMMQSYHEIKALFTMMQSYKDEPKAFWAHFLLMEMALERRVYLFIMMQAYHKVKPMCLFNDVMILQSQTHVFIIDVVILQSQTQLIAVM